MATIRELADYYVALMASIYRTKYKASNNVALYAKQVLADNFAATFNAGFDIETAVGAQLDILGKYIGAPREIEVEDTRPFFGYVGYDYPTAEDNNNGFVLYESLATNAEGVWYEYLFQSQATNALTDYQYRQLMRLKISTNNTENTMSAIQTQIAEFFPGQLQLRDNKNMTLTYFFGSSFQLPLSVLEAYLPRPMGVLVEAVEAIAFDVTVDGAPAFNSQTPSPEIDFGSISFSLSVTVVITNATTSDFTVLTINSDEAGFVVSGVSPALPVTLAQGESVQFTLSATSSDPASLTGVLSIFTTSSAGLSRFDVNLVAVVSGVFLDWISFDNFDDYSNGTISSLTDSWGWAASGVFNEYLMIIPQDDFEEYALGSIAALNGGSNWLADGIFTTY